MEEAFGLEFEPLNDDFNENILDKDYIESEIKCLKSIEGFTSIGNLILEKNKNTSLEKKEEEKFYIVNGGEMGKLKRDIDETKKKIKLLKIELGYLNNQPPSDKKISKIDPRSLFGNEGGSYRNNNNRDTKQRTRI
ncbi:hypothetical protein DICPUDRAFT_84605 [Dictyostelium purpureum]|uniref:Uncharacterized protein n=1 Tax=Dictyostelium purpureum TaxID=5786 RepID=F1A362_DICPU|nr:uncharacterized protein DICPUDRAFT_84605 [Dictyostelium purpureum]EGC29364.1 hypothetical protein DICPUDRAFT_84605 [Dictyostelium purpureum]|eukprot:XP_003294108.1 hypothetical protein DICPUDRAFT_84605 [Dictyostelium purpureum]